MSKSLYSPTKNGPANTPRAKRPYKTPDGETTLLTDKQHSFAKAALEIPTSNALIKRVQEIYHTDRANALVIARENFVKPNIMLYMGDRGYKALDTINELAQNPEIESSVRLGAARDLADRTFGKPTQRTEVKQQTVTVDLNFSNGDIEI